MFKKTISFFLAVVLVFGTFGGISAFAASDSSEVKPELHEDKFPNDVYLIDKNEYNVAPGVYETHFVANNAEGTRQNLCYALTIDMKEASIVASYKNQDGTVPGMQTVRDQAYAAEEKRGLNIVAGVNADIYDMSNGAPMSELIMDGVKYFDPPIQQKPYFAILKDGTPVIRDYGVPTDDVKEAVGLWCIFVRDGVNVTQKVGIYDTTDQPRTAIGIKADGSVVMIVNDGRLNPTSSGLTWSETADMLISMGCVQAGNLDGGGSSTLVSQHEGSSNLELRNIPCNGSERNVSTALLVASNYASDANYSYASVSCVKDEIPAGGSVDFTVKGCDKSGGYAPLPSDAKLYLSDSSFGTISAQGKFVSNGKTGNVKVICGNGTAVYGSADLKIVSGGINYSSYTGIVTNPSTGKKSFLLRGAKITNKWMPVNTDLYYFDQNGEAVTGNYTITQSVEPTREGIGDFLFNGEKVSLTYHFDKDGKLDRGAVVNKNGATYYLTGGFIQFGWHYYDGNWHYFDGIKNAKNYGKMLKGIWTRNNQRFECDSAGNLKKGFVFEDEGGMKYIWAGQLVSGWQNIDGYTWGDAKGKNYKRVTGRYYFNGENSCYLERDKAMIDGVMHYFKADGTLDSGLRNEKDGTLYLDKNGVPMTGWITVGDKTYYFDPANNGYMVPDSDQVINITEQIFRVINKYFEIIRKLIAVANAGK